MSISLGRYLFERLHQKPLDVGTVFGVPGDFNLTLLDKLYEVEGLQWGCSTNELNAAYSADAYSRVKSGNSDNSNGFAAVVTTFGVGELSAINGIAGSYAEHVGLLHIVGIPSVSSQQKQLLLHHTLGNGDFTVFERMSSRVTQTTAVLKDTESAADEIDRVIRAAYIHQRPTYLAFPANMVDVEVPKSRLDKPLDLEPPANDEEVQEEVLERVLELIKGAKDPLILIDACAARHNATLEANKLIKATNFKFAITPMAKGSKHIDEKDERFAGVYVGSLSYPDVKEAVESSDLILSLGAMLSDFNTGSFSYSYQTKNVVEFHSDYTKIRNASYPNVRMKEVLQKLLDHENFAASYENYAAKPVAKNPFPEEKQDDETPISQKWLWLRFSSFLRDGDVVITETGTSSFGIIQTQFPKGVLGISQVLWGSIGYSVGAAYGAVAAAEEIDPKKRVLLFVGDGSLQLTVQEISSMVRKGTHPYLFVLNNNGYTIEKLIHGETAEYNQIQPWDHLKILETFKAQEAESKSVRLAKELDELLADEKFADNDKIRLVEIVLETMDAPVNLVEQAKLSSQANAEN